jgi:hypothetical protein
VIAETESNANDNSESTDTSSANLQTLKSMQATNTDTFTSEFNDFKTTNNMPDLTMEKLSQNSDLYNKFMTKVNKVETVNQKNTINEKTEHSTLAQPSNNPNVVVKTDNQDVVKALDGLPPVKLHCSVLAEEAIHEAIADYYRKQGKMTEEEIKIKCGLKEHHCEGCCGH